MNPVVILAGGFGTRLRPVVTDLPKPLAPVAGRPFLWWLLRSLEVQGVQDVYLATGYKAALIEAAFGERFGPIRLHYVVEDEPLGTGGAILRASRDIETDEFFVLNGDTLAVADLSAMALAAQRHKPDATLAVARVDNAARYGTIAVDQQNQVTAFRAKGASGPGFISAGVYLIRHAALDPTLLPAKFSIEQDFFERELPRLRISAFPAVEAFIDIGVPEDYALAQTKIPSIVDRL